MTDPHPGGIRSAVTSEFHRAGITPVRFSEPTPVEHPKGTRFNRAGGAGADFHRLKNEWAIAL